MTLRNVAVLVVGAVLLIGPGTASGSKSAALRPAATFRTGTGRAMLLHSFTPISSAGNPKTSASTEIPRAHPISADLKLNGMRTPRVPPPSCNISHDPLGIRFVFTRSMNAPRAPSKRFCPWNDETPKS